MEQGRFPIIRRDGTTDSERYLKRLCDHTFLSLWSYPNIYRNQGNGVVGHGKEVCDLLVVFDDHIIIFSDKYCRFPNTGDLWLDWCRWYRKTVKKSAEQIWGAERWIKTHPDRLFIDQSCNQPLPIYLPDLSTTKFHRIVIAHDSGQRCREELGGTGSLMIWPSLIGDEHCLPNKEDGIPFAIGQVDPNRGFIHVFDDVTLDIVMQTQDTITDFVHYLSNKEDFLVNGQLLAAAGEEDLLAYYLQNLNDENEHDFVFPRNMDGVIIDEGFWEEFSNHPQRQAQIAANRVSYSWDKLIETFSKHILEGTQYFETNIVIAQSELALRFLARESRTARRVLAKALMDALEKTPVNYRNTRVILPRRPGEPCYVFLLLPHLASISDEGYRVFRRDLLGAYCKAAKYRFPHVEDIIGIATETGLDSTKRSEDLMYLDVRQWTDEQQAEAQGLQDELGLLTKGILFHTNEREFPDDLSIDSLTEFNKKPIGSYPRNSRCPCGSGRKYKKCCGKPGTRAGSMKV